MRLLLALLALFAVAVYSQPDCCSSFCASVGDTCNFSCPVSGARPACLNSHCDPISNECVEIADLTEDCTSTGDGPDCIGSQYFYFYDTSCLDNDICGTASLQPQLAGDPCDVAEGAVGTAATTGGCPTSTSTCDTGFCTGNALGADCGAVGCLKGGYCDISSFPFSCVPFGVDGDACSLTASCRFDFVCLTQSSTCGPFFTAATDDDCGAGTIAGITATGGSASLECDYTAGEACAGGTCQVPDDTFVGDACDPADPDACGQLIGPDGYYACVEDACGQPSGNFCVPLYAIADDTVATAYEAYAVCIGSNNCTAAFFTPPPFKGTILENCAYTNCFADWTAYVDTWKPNPYQYTECTPPNPTIGPTGPTGTTTGTPTGNPTTGTPTGNPTTGTPTGNPTTGNPTTGNPTVRGTTRATTTATSADDDDGAAAIAASVLLVVFAFALLL